MGRTNKRFTLFVDGVLEYYAAGHTVTETAQHFDVTKNQVRYWAKTRHVSNGRTFEQGGRECNLKRSQGLLPMPQGANERVKELASQRWSARLNTLGFELIEWRGKQSGVTLKCMKCGEVFDRSSYRGVNCPRCYSDACRSRAEEKKRQQLEEQERKKLLRKEKHKGLELEEQQRLNAPHICEECGKVYTIRSYMANTGYKYRRHSGVCSAECRDKRKKRKQEECSKKRGAHSEHHYDRAKRLGLPAEKGVTLKKLYKRDGGICQICGLVCDYSGNGLSDLYPSIDHIIPLGRDTEKVGGHTWANVQLAHRICNSVKSAKRGEEWSNGTT